ncbi:MAG: 30S ribosomal protein S9 [Dehalococcoidia bacterium]|nr:30S ribosomal protein S9 [Dehalococcoidia bacterium]
MVQENARERYYYGTGKRKTAIAKVRLYVAAGGGAASTAAQYQINSKPLDEYFPWQSWQNSVQEPLRVTGNVGKFNVVARVLGGGISAQADAVRHGISRALVVYDETHKPALRKNGLLTRDARIKESKKYGLKRARRAPQYTKR